MHTSQGVTTRQRPSIRTHAEGLDAVGSFDPLTGPQTLLIQLETIHR
jgi:hypothetical protein